MKYVVTGGAGFIGSHLCVRLISEGHSVWCVDDLSTGTLDNLSQIIGNDRFRFIPHDIRDPLPEMIADAIYNLACPASPPAYQSDAVGTMRTNILGVLNVLDLAQQHGAVMLQASTSEVYGDAEVHPQPESYVGAVSITGPRACYDEGKRAAETLCYDHHRQFGTRIRVARLFNTYGPNMRPDDGRVVSNLIVQALQGEPLTIYGAGAQTRSFCYITDMVEALVRLMDAPGDCVGPVNLGNQGEFTVRELAELVLQKTGSASSITHLPLPMDDPRVRRPDTTLAYKLLNWQAVTPLDVGLDHTIAYYRAWHEGQLLPRDKPQVSTNVVAIIGGGPAGLTAAYELQKLSGPYQPIVLEASDMVGGISRTESYKGYRFDIGGHRFFSKVSSVTQMWHEVLGKDFIRRPRLSRIYYRGRYYSYPIKMFNALSNLGPYESVRILGSYIKWKVVPHKVEDSFEQWVTNRFGSRLFSHFFKSYTEKVWGIPCTEIRSDWAAQRIKNLSLRKTVLNAISKTNDVTSLIEEFDYPRLGPGMMWEAVRDKVRAQSGEVRMLSSVARVRHDEARVTAVDIIQRSPAGDSHYRMDADHVISSMPLGELVLAMDPPAPAPIQAAARRLKYRDFLIVALILDSAEPFPDNWVYIHSPDVQVGRIQNFRSWSPGMIPNDTSSSIGMEFFCQEGDALWASDDADLIAQATREFAHLKLAPSARVIDGHVIRQPKAYPVYDFDFAESLVLIRGWLSGLSNLQVVGRNGMHRYNNQDHSMLTAMLAARNILGEDHDLWSVNVEQEYHEIIETSADVDARAGSAFGRSARFFGNGRRVGASA